MQPPTGPDTLAPLDDLDRQLRWLRRFAVVTYPFACVPFLFPYFASHGMDEARYGEILTAYYATMFLAEVPTGVLADRFGPHRMLVLGPLLLAAGFATLFLFPTYAGFLSGEALLGLAHSVLSGPPTVVLYETLRRHGQEHRYLAEESRVHARRLYGTGCAFLLGGALVRLGDRDGHAYVHAIVATCALNVLAAAFASRLRAPRAHVAMPGPGEHPARFLADARRELAKPAVLWLLCYWVVLFTLLRFPFHDYQPYLLAVGAFEPWFADAVVVGAIFALLNLVAAPLSGAVPRLVERFGRVVLFWGMPLSLCASLVVMALAVELAGPGARLWCWVGVAMFFVQQVPFATHWSLLHEFANHRIGPAARTTVLSVLSLGARAVYAGLNVALFHVQAQHGIATALGLAALGGVVAAALVLWLRPRGLLRGEGRVA